MLVIEIKIENCTGCGTCADQCPNQVFVIVNGKVVVKSPDECMVCRLCETTCPQMGITVKE
ncbi:MAG: 4Fe-4S binding protein [Deltaproteobacteria bacterium]|nr:4Fe-4S binding protein [Deltaproteobacteria bacterium]